MRRLLYAVAILGLYMYPMFQILLSLALTLAQLVILVQLSPYDLKTEQATQVGNEMVTLLTLYFLLLFIQDFMVDNKLAE